MGEDGSIPTLFPKKGEIVTVECISPEAHDHLWLVEYSFIVPGFGRAAWWCGFFIPIVGKSATTELSSFIEVIEKSDCPIKIEQPVLT